MFAIYILNYYLYSFQNTCTYFNKLQKSKIITFHFKQTEQKKYAMNRKLTFSVLKIILEFFLVHVHYIIYCWNICSLSRLALITSSNVWISQNAYFESDSVQNSNVWISQNLIFCVTTYMKVSIAHPSVSRIFGKPQAFP